VRQLKQRVALVRGIRLAVPLRPADEKLTEAPRADRRENERVGKGRLAQVLDCRTVGAQARTTGSLRPAIVGI
jgi:hypothetical protein